MDLTKLSDEDLRALQSGDLTKVSDEGLQHLNSPTITEPAPGVQAGAAPEQSGIINDYVAPAFGVGKAALDVGGAALGNPLVQHGLELAGGGYAAKRFLVNPVLDALRPVGQAVGQRVGDVTNALNRQASAAEASEAGIANRAAQRSGVPVNRAPVAPTYNAPTGVPNTRPMPMPTNMGAPTGMPVSAPTAQPSMVQRGMDYANQMRQIAAQKVISAAPTLEGAGQQIANFAQKAAPYINNPLTRNVAKLGGVAAQMGTYHGGLNTNEEQELARRRGMGPTIR